LVSPSIICFCEAKKLVNLNREEVLTVMDWFIEAVLGNIVPLIIIAGVIINFFKRIAGSNQNQDQNKNRNQGQQRSASAPSNTNENKPKLKDLFEQLEEVFNDQPVGKPPAPKKVEPDVPSAANEFQTRYEDLKSRENVVETKAPAEKKVMKKKAEPTSSLTISKKKAVQGIIWSEVLGPPRSKRPYQNRGYYK